MGAPKPPVIPEPFANAATDGTAPGNKTNPLPDTVTNAQLASWRAGFQALTMQPVTAGGKPPLGQDVNGVLFALSAHNYYVQAGQLFQYDSTVRDAIGGYAVGCILESTDGTTVWVNIVANNMTDPDSGSAVGWVSLATYGFLTLSGLTGGTVTLTPQQAARRTIVLNGVLTSNLAIVLPNSLSRWLFVNNATGSFTVTARTAAGTGVTVPAGGFSNPLEVYGDGTNIYPTVAPLGIPISQAADPLTLVERTNVGYVYARYFNQNSASNENPAIGSIFVEQNTSDGFLRKATLAFVEASMALSAIGGQVTAGQVPLSAVLQYAAQILSNPALTGTSTAPTVANGTSNTQIATTAFVNPSSSLGVNGFRKNPDGTIDQWGRIHIGDVVGPTSAFSGFNIAFPTACYGVEITGFDANATGATYALATNGAPGQNGFTWAAREIASATQDVTIMWRAIGA